MNIIGLCRLIGARLLIRWSSKTRQYRTADGGELWHDNKLHKTGASQLAMGSGETLFGWI
jgi:hypothetical protein